MEAGLIGNHRRAPKKVPGLHMARITTVCYYEVDGENCQELLYAKLSGLSTIHAFTIRSVYYSPLSDVCNTFNQSDNYSGSFFRGSIR